MIVPGYIATSVLLRNLLTIIRITGMNAKESVGNISQQAAGYCTPAYTG
jgi:hypothetical protein